MVQYANKQHLISRGNSTCVGLQFDARVSRPCFYFCVALRQLSKYISVCGKGDETRGTVNLVLIKCNLSLLFTSAYLDNRR